MEFKDVVVGGEDLTRDLVIGFLITKVRTVDKKGFGRHEILVRPLTCSYEGLGSELSLDEEEKVVAVIPAPPGSYLVWDFLPPGVSDIEAGNLPSVGEV
jgi:hypothetical protein